MTEKELLYLDDAINHEINLISYLEYAISSLSDSKLIEFIKKELKNHEMINSNLIANLEECSNE